MDFGFTEEQEKLRKEVTEFYLNELPSDFLPNVEAMSEEAQSFFLQLQKKAGEKGYLTAGWPKEYGGMGLGEISQGIVNEVEGWWAFYKPNLIGLHLAGPGTIIFGTEEQKQWAIPPITRGEVVWFEAFTEPDAGSDEANQQTRAVEDGDYFVVNGQKAFISGGYKPDWLFTELRTADTIPKHRGLSLFLIPADLPGITYRPLPTMGFGPQNEIFFDDVRVHKKYLLGELNKGFYHAMQVFEFERSGTNWPADAKHRLMKLVQFCKEEKLNGRPLIEDPKVRDLLARIAIKVEVWRLVSWRTIWRIGERERLGPLDYDLTGFYHKACRTEFPQLMMGILGTYGQLRHGSKWAKLAGEIEYIWQLARSLHAGGTIEIYKIVLAQRGLGLPRQARAESAKSGGKE